MRLNILVDIGVNVLLHDPAGMHYRLDSAWQRDILPDWSGAVHISLHLGLLDDHLGHFGLHIFLCDRVCDARAVNGLQRLYHRLHHCLRLQVDSRSMLHLRNNCRLLWRYGSNHMLLWNRGCKRLRDVVTNNCPRLHHSPSRTA